MTINYQFEQQQWQTLRYSEMSDFSFAWKWKFILKSRQISDLPGSGVVACLCGNTTGGGQKPPPPPIGWTTLTGLARRAAPDGTNNGDAAYVSGTVLYDDRGRLSVRDGDLEPKRNGCQAQNVNCPCRLIRFSLYLFWESGGKSRLYTYIADDCGYSYHLSAKQLIS